jgi:hypothetical protein
MLLVQRFNGVIELAPDLANLLSDGLVNGAKRAEVARHSLRVNLRPDSIISGASGAEDQGTFAEFQADAFALTRSPV